MIRTTLTLTLALLTASCLGGGNDERPITQASGKDTCDALRPDYPIPYHDSKDWVVDRYRRMNAAFKKVCP